MAIHWMDEAESYGDAAPERYLRALRREKTQVAALKAVGRTKAWLKWCRDLKEGFKRDEQMILDDIEVAAAVERLDKPVLDQSLILPWVREALKMRREGCTFQQISNRFGYSKQCIMTLIKSAETELNSTNYTRPPHIAEVFNVICEASTTIASLIEELNLDPDIVEKAVSYLFAKKKIRRSGDIYYIRGPKK